MSILISIPAIIIAVVAHEWAHGFMSYLLGDETAKKDGRLSLNPLKHIDMYGFLCLLVFHLGWAKPVHINPYMYKNRKLGTALTAFAGPFMNLIMAFLAIFSIGIIEEVTTLELNLILATPLVRVVQTNRVYSSHTTLRTHHILTKSTTTTAAITAT